METKRYLGVADIGAWFDVTSATVSKWITRYAESHPTPVPDVQVGGEGRGSVKGWLPKREQEWREWEKGRPGRGAGGGRPPYKERAAE